MPTFTTINDSSPSITIIGGENLGASSDCVRKTIAKKTITVTEGMTVKYTIGSAGQGQPSIPDLPKPESVRKKQSRSIMLAGLRNALSKMK